MSSPVIIALQTVQKSTEERLYSKNALTISFNLNSLLLFLNIIAYMEREILIKFVANQSDFFVNL